MVRESTSMQPSPAHTSADVLRSNLTDPSVGVGPDLDGEPESEAYADFAVAAGLLALIVTAIVVVVGPHLGGPAPSLTFWLRLGPLLVVPLSILFALLLTPGGVVRGRSRDWRVRVGLALAGLSVFAAALLLLNLSTFLTRH